MLTGGLFRINGCFRNKGILFHYSNYPYNEKVYFTCTNSLHITEQAIAFDLKYKFNNANLIYQISAGF